MTGSAIDLGMAATALALALAVLAVVFSLYGERAGRPAFVAVSRQALYANFFLITLAMATVVAAFVVQDFSVLYVAQNSNSRLPFIYRLSALWGAHEGSLLLWLWYLVLFSALAVFIHRRSHPRSMPYIVATLAAIQIGFLSLILFLSSPFTEVFPPLPDGRDLNPLLQDPGLIFHPPLLYLGYVGFSVPFAFAIAALIRGRADAEWVVATRRWTLFAWMGLTSGIMLGGYWAYYELGWGGYWAWDPVENASLMPWLTGTAFLHSVMAQERRGLFGGWNLFLVITTFSLSLLGTFLVRSGVLTSVHAFAVDPARGLYILIFLGFVLAGGFGLFILRVERLRGRQSLEAATSREATLLYNNLFLLVAMVTVFVGTLYPLAVEVVADERLTVAAPYFNQVMPPILIAVVLLMGIGPVVPWRRATARRLVKRFVGPFAVGLACTAALALAGVHNLLALAALLAVFFTLAATLLDVLLAARTRAGSWKPLALTVAFVRLLRMNRRRYGGLTVHLGVLLIALGILGSGVFRETVTLSLQPGERFAVGDYLLTYRGIEGVEGPNYTARRARFGLSRDGVPLEELRPERRNYPGGEMVTTEAAIRSTPLADLYLVVGDEQSDKRISVRAFHNPLVGWIWFGWLVIGFGAALAFSHGRLLPARAEERGALGQEAAP